MRLSKMLFFLCFRPTIKFQGGSPVDPLFEPPADPPFDSTSQKLFSSSFRRLWIEGRNTPFREYDPLPDLFSHRFREGISFPKSVWKKVHPGAAPLQALLCALYSTEQSTFWEGEKGEKVPRKGEEEGWPAKGAKRKKGRVKTDPLRVRPSSDAAAANHVPQL